MENLLADVEALVLGLAPAAAVFALLALVLKRRRILSALRNSWRETLTNLGLIALSSIVLGAAFHFVEQNASAHLALFPQLAATWDALPQVWLLVLALLIDDFIVYWRHRFEHMPLWWPVHAVHHSDEAITWLTLQRKHPLGKLLGLLVDAAPLIILGFPLWVIAASAFIRTWWGYFIHADLPWTLGPLGRVLLSPAAHRMHHIDDEELMGRNYGGFFTLWDRVFGTWDDAAEHVGCRTGIAGGSKHLGGELLRPFAAWFGKPAKPPASGQAQAEA
ncbi:sterol desaturase family protein [Paraurantiacibacter namhicola]|uniref:Fatty acid hydroxylase superfamily protein n=1 Tax=Paraurantiacibacter namhicola TaxID=645517 RepID=A0A1C7D8S5_9SPHN|nr:sterol desaturase family protein [Paraurantiacibacter namhicola]ANU07721.1 Fatty acid hydroxylase superfamily protein [Paraurantiacibacter namhicola]